MKISFFIHADQVPGPEPFHPVDDGVDRRLGGALTVGVLNAQHHFAAMASGVEPVEERRARAANVQKTGGRGRKSGDDVGHVGGVFRSRAKDAPV